MSEWKTLHKTEVPGFGRALTPALRYARIGAVAVAAAAVVALAIVLWPLADAQSGAPGDGDAAGSGTDADAPLSGASREPMVRDVAALGGSYLFSAGREPAAVTPGGRAEQEVSEAEPVDPTPVVAPAPSERAADGVRVLRVEAPEAVGGEVQKSFRELVLRAIHSDRRGELVALIDFTGAPAGSASVRVGPGGSFTEPKHTDTDWSVVAIDPDRNRVVLERENRRLALALFGTGPADLSPVVIAPEGERGATPPDVFVGEDGTVIVRQSPDEAIAALRREVGPGSGDEKPITFDDLAELLRAFGDLERYAERARQEQLERERR